MRRAGNAFFIHNYENHGHVATKSISRTALDKTVTKGSAVIRYLRAAFAPASGASFTAI
jgi:hypothetical protein